MSSTVYDVKVRYAMDDQASSKTKALAGELDKAGKNALNLKAAAIAIGVGLAGAFAIGKKTLIDFNSQMDQMKIGMTTIMNMQLKKPWEEASKSVDKLFFKFQELAKKSPATTKDFMVMANAITPVIASLGGGVAQIEKLTQGAVLAGIATGTRADVAALDIKQMLMGTVTERDMMAQQLISAQGMTKEDFNDLDSSKRGNMVEKMLQDPALLRAADAFGESFAGQTAAFTDNLQIGLGQIGKPLMQAMSEEVKKWNTWIEKHPRTIAKISKDLSEMLKSSFEFVQTTVGWLVDNKEILFAIGKTFLVFKGAGLATSAMQGLVGSIGNFVTAVRTGTANLTGMFGGGVSGGLGTLSKILTGVGGVVPGFIALATATSALWGIFTDKKKQEQNKILKQDFEDAMGYLGKFSTRLDELDKMFTFRGANTPTLAVVEASKGGKFDQERYDRIVTERESLKKAFSDTSLQSTFIKGYSEAIIKLNDGRGLADYSKKDFQSFGSQGVSFDIFSRLFDDSLGKNEKVLNQLNSTLERFNKQLSPNDKDNIFQQAFADQFKPKDVEPVSQWKEPSAEKTDVKVTIHKIEVASDDPDRFVFGMVKAFNNFSKNPTQAASAIGD